MNQEIPDGWNKVKFKELAKQKSVRIDNPGESGFEKYVGLEHLDSGELVIKRYGSTSDVTSTMKLFNKGDILFARRNTYLKRVSVAPFDGVCSGDIIVLEPILNHIVEGFLPIFMQFEPFENKIIALSAGAFSKRIKWNQLAEENIVIPSIEEQKKISKIIWSIDENAEKGDKLFSSLSHIKEGLIHVLFKINLPYKNHIEPDVSSLPDGWDIVNISDLVLNYKNGFASGERDENGIVQIRMNNVSTDGKIDLTKHLKVPIHKNIQNYELEKGDLLFNNTNSVDLVGKSAIFYNAPFPCTFSNHFTRLRFNPDKVLPEYVLNHIVTYQNAGYFKYMANRHVGQSGVDLKDLLKIRIPLPSLSTQKDILNNIELIDMQIEIVSQNSHNLLELKKKLTNDYLSGKLLIPKEVL